VVVSDSVPTTKSVYVLNYSDLSLVGSELLPAGSAADTSKRAVVIAGSWLYLGFNGRVYKYTFPGLVYSNDAAITGSVADILAGVWGVDDNVIVFVENTKIFFVAPTTLATLDSATLTHAGATSVTWVTDWNQYLVNSTSDDVFSLYDSSLVLVRNIELPVSVLNAGGVTALGRRLYLGDTTIPNNYFMIVDDDIVMISYDPLWKEYWISLRDKSYIYTADGKLGGPMDWSVTSLYRDAVDALTGIAYDNNSGDRQVEVRTVPLNFTERGEKQVIEFLVESESINTRRACVAWRNDATLRFKNSPWVPFSPEGAAFPICSFVDGKVRVKGNVNDNELAEIQRIEVRYIATDLRFRRGAKAETGAL
jgi:hypothetical protein